MSKKYLLNILLAFSPLLSWGQSSAVECPVVVADSSVIHINCSSGTSCPPITAHFPDIRNTNSYKVDSTNINYADHYAFNYPGATTIFVGEDDIFSSVINLPFNFCFYGQTYDKVVIGANGILTFDLSKANSFCTWSTTSVGPIPTTSTSYARPSIMAVYHDIDPSISGTGPEIEYALTGTAPCRKLIVNYRTVAHFNSSFCPGYQSTFQIVLYENTNVIDVYIKDKPACTGWNDGKAILGLLNATGTQATVVPGKNNTVWGSANMNKAYRFIPNGTSLLSSVELLNDGVVIATGTATPGSAGELDVTFTSGCVPAGSTDTFVVRANYVSCSGAPLNPTDTVIVINIATTPAPAAITPVTYCQGATATALSATGTALLWYTLPSGGTGSATAPVPATTTPGTFTWYVSQTLTGCESPRTPVTVVVHPNASNTITAAVCSGSGYSYNGTTYTATGSYVHHFFTANGCDSAVTLNLTVNPVVTGAITASICNGGSYSFGGSTYTASGTYTKTFAAATGCDSTVTLTLTVNPTYNTAFNATTCQGTPYAWAGMTYATAGSYPRTFTSSKGCDSVVTLNLTVNPTYNTAFSATICQGESYAFGGSTYTASGAYPHTFSTVKGCDSIVTLNLTVHPVYNISLDVAVCEGTTYTWAGGSYTDAGSYLKHFTTTKGCDSNVTLHLTVNPVAHTSFSASICKGDTYTFGGNTYSFQGDYLAQFTSVAGCDSFATLHLLVQTAYNQTFQVAICQGESYNWNGQSYNTSGTYQALFSTIYGCDSLVRLVLTVNPAYNQIVKAKICQGESFQFAGNTYRQSGDYPFAFQTKKGCDSLVTLRLTVVPLPQVRFALPDKACAGTPVNVVLNYTNLTPEDGRYEWDFNRADILTGRDGGPYRVVWHDTGWHQVRLTGYNWTCGADSHQDSIYVSPLPLAKIIKAPAGNFCALDTVAFTALPGAGYQFAWAPAAWVVTQNSEGMARLRVQQTGWVNLQVSNANGCLAADSVFVDTKPCCEAGIPDAFTPNGDGRNDVFRLITEGHQQIVSLRILNRWGQVVFETHGEGIGWDGTYKGLPQDMGVYMYYLKYKCTDGHTYEKQGDVTLVR